MLQHLRFISVRATRTQQEMLRNQVNLRIKNGNFIREIAKSNKSHSPTYIQSLTCHTEVHGTLLTRNHSHENK